MQSASLSEIIHDKPMSRTQKRTKTKNKRKRAQRRLYYALFEFNQNVNAEIFTEESAEAKRALEIRWKERDIEISQQFERKMMSAEDFLASCLRNISSKTNCKDSAVASTFQISKVGSSSRFHANTAEQTNTVFGPQPLYKDLRAPSNYDPPLPPEVSICPFFWRTGACRYGLDCSKGHPVCQRSTTLLVSNMFAQPSVTVFRGENADNELEVSEAELQLAFEDFYDDTYPEFSEYGEVTHFYVCRNKCAHLKGNVYITYQTQESSSKAFLGIQTRLYAGKQLFCQFVAIPSWREAICDLFRQKRCARGGSCNFLHPFWKDSTKKQESKFQRTKDLRVNKNKRLKRSASMENQKYSSYTVIRRENKNRRRNIREMKHQYKHEKEPNRKEHKHHSLKRTGSKGSGSKSGKSSERVSDNNAGSLTSNSTCTTCAIDEDDRWPLAEWDTEAGRDHSSMSNVTEKQSCNFIFTGKKTEKNKGSKKNKMKNSKSNEKQNSKPLQVEIMNDENELRKLALASMKNKVKT